MQQIPYRYKINTSSFAYYWREGMGTSLLEKLGYTPDLGQAECLIPYLFAWDKEGDQIVFDIHEKIGFKAASESLSAYLQNTLQDKKLRERWSTFFNTLNITPTWLDLQKLKSGSELCRRAGLSALIVLRDYCLMGGYESAAINKPLIFTGALKKGAVKRLTDTVNFWVHITKENGLLYQSEGFKQIILTRLIHSYSRINIIKHTDWNTEKWGIPINLWDMLATNLGFSLVFLIGLRRIGIQPTDTEIEGLFHFWKYVGFLLGIPLELLPDTEEEAIEALYLWTMTQREGDQDTKMLAEALKNEPIYANYPSNKLMRMMMKEIHLFYNHYLLGDYSCQLLGLPKTKIGRFGIINIWRAHKNEKLIVDELSRLQAIRNGEEEQERVRLIYQKYNTT